MSKDPSQTTKKQSKKPKASKINQDNIEKIRDLLNTGTSEVYLLKNNNKYRLQLLSSYKLDELIIAVISSDKIEFLDLFSENDIKRNLSICLKSSLTYNRKKFIEHFVTKYKNMIEFNDVFNALISGNSNHNLELGNYLISCFPDMKQELKDAFHEENYSDLYIDSI